MGGFESHTERTWFFGKAVMNVAAGSGVRLAAHRNGGTAIVFHGAQA
jgi:hypothetical protein